MGVCMLGGVLERVRACGGEERTGMRCGLSGYCRGTAGRTGACDGGVCGARGYMSGLKGAMTALLCMGALGSGGWGCWHGSVPSEHTPKFDIKPKSKIPMEEEETSAPPTLRTMHATTHTVAKEHMRVNT